jgi:hypothetical protein
MITQNELTLKDCEESNRRADKLRTALQETREKVKSLEKQI